MVAKNGKDDVVDPFFLPEIMKNKTFCIKSSRCWASTEVVICLPKPGDSQPSFYKWRLVAGNAFQI